MSFVSLWGTLTCSKPGLRTRLAGSRATSPGALSRMRIIYSPVCALKSVERSSAVKVLPPSVLNQELSAFVLASMSIWIQLIWPSVSPSARISIRFSGRSSLRSMGASCQAR